MTNKKDAALFAALDTHRKTDEKARRYGLRVAAYLRRTFPGHRIGGSTTKPKMVLDPKGPPDTHTAAVVLATVLDRCTTPDCQLLAEWIAERFWGLQIERLMPDIQRLYKELIRRKHTRRNKFVFNDLDNRVWYEPHSQKKVIGFDSQGREKIMVWIGDDAFWEELHFRSLRPRRIIKYDFKYVEAISFQWCRDNDFKLGYGDCRDVGYMFSYERIAGQAGHVNRACDHQGDLWLFGFEINSTLTALRDERPAQ